MSSEMFREVNNQWFEIKLSYFFGSLKTDGNETEKKVAPWLREKWHCKTCTRMEIVRAKSNKISAVKNATDNLDP